MPRGLTILMPLILATASCAPLPELRLVLADVSPDPLADAVSLRVTYDPGDGSRVSVTLPLDEGEEPWSGVDGASIRDLQIEALAAGGEVVARGHRDGDLTPALGQPLEVPVVVLGVGVFSTVSGVRLSAPRSRPCLVRGPDDVLLVAGGGSTSVERLDARSGTIEDGALVLSTTAVVCQAAPIGGDAVVLAGSGSSWLEVIGMDGSTSHGAMDTGRVDGALASIAGGDAAWWMGGPDDETNLTSELIDLDGSDPADGPVVPGGARSGHGIACTAAGDRCAVFGADEGSVSWWRVEGQDVVEGAGGLTLDPLVHDDEQLTGIARDGGSLDSSAVIGLLERGGTTVVVVFDVADDGTILLEQTLAPDLLSPTLAASANGWAWVIGGVGGGVVSGDVQQVVRDGVEVSFSSRGLALDVPRRDAAAAVLGDGRVVVVGGVDEGGTTLDEIEIYQP